MTQLPPGVDASVGAEPSSGRMAELDGHLFLGYGDFLVRTLYRSLDPLLRYSTRIGLEPIHYSYANLGAGVLGAALIAGGRLQAGACLVALSGVADVVDGRLARATGRASTRGDFIDSTFDRFVDVAVFLALAFQLRATAWGWLLAAAAMGTSLLVSYTRARGEVHGVRCPGGLMQRQERILLVSLACFVDPIACAASGWTAGAVLSWTLFVIIAATLVTAIHRTITITSRLR